MSVAALVAREILTDYEDQSAELAAFYSKLTPEQQAAVDEAFTFLCGWRLKSILEMEGSCD